MKSPPEKLTLKKLIQGLVSADQVCQDNVMIKIGDALQAKKESLKSSRTAAMWLQYMDMIDILRKCIRAERTGNWELHLQAVSEMLPYLAASRDRDRKRAKEN